MSENVIGMEEQLAKARANARAGQAAASAEAAEKASNGVGSAGDTTKKTAARGGKASAALAGQLAGMALPTVITAAGGDDESEDEARGVDRLLSVALANVDLMLDAQGVPMLVPHEQPRRCLSVDSEEAKWWLLRLGIAHRKRVPAGGDVEQVQHVLAAFARQKAQEQVYVRVAGLRDRTYIDMCNAAGEFIEIDAAGWRIVGRAPVPFRQARGMQPLPAPKRDPNITWGTFFDLVRVADDASRVLVLGWVLVAARGVGPFPVGEVVAAHGSAKSTACRVMRNLVDPLATELMRMPTDDQAFLLPAHTFWVSAYDNVSHLDDGRSDDLCQISTGGGMMKRALYSNTGLVQLAFRRPQLINGIESVVTRADLLDRTWQIRLRPIAPEERLTDAALAQRIDAVMPGLLALLFDAVSASIANHAAALAAVQGLPRLADAAAVVLAAEPVLGLPISVTDALRENTELAAVTAVENNAVGRALLRAVPAGAVLDVDMTELLQQLDAAAPQEDRRIKGWPTHPNKLRGVLRRLGPSLVAVGIRVDLDMRLDPQTRRVRVRIENTNQHPLSAGRPAAAFGADAAVQAAAVQAFGDVLQAVRDAVAAGGISDELRLAVRAAVACHPTQTRRGVAEGFIAAGAPREVVADLVPQQVDPEPPPASPPPASPPVGNAPRKPARRKSAPAAAPPPASPGANGPSAYEQSVLAARDRETAAFEGRKRRLAPRG